MACIVGAVPHKLFQLCTVMLLSSIVANVASQFIRTFLWHLSSKDPIFSFSDCEMTQDTGHFQALLNSGNISAMIPSTPDPANVNCYVDVELMETVGGHCVRFGRSRIWSCQSGIHITLSPECGRQNRRQDRTKR